MARKMKDSGIEWIGEIPEEWEVSKISQLYSERKTKVNDRDFPPLSVTMKGIVPQLSTAAKSDAHDDRKLLCKGDFAINSRSDRRGSCGVSKYDGSVSLINTVLMPKVVLNASFYDWLFHTSMFADEFYKWGHGIVDDLWTTNWQDMKKIQILVPELKEQQRIADFLDQKCAQIDEILQKTRDTIAEYKKLKQSIITQAVTKGVRGERPMKDSGIEWIGEIPEEWEVKKLKYCTIFAPNCNTDKFNADTEVTFSPMECIHNGFFENRKSNFAFFNSSYTQYQEGDIVFAKVTPCFENGNIAIMENLFSGFGFGSSELFIVRPITVDTRYLFYFLQNDIFKTVACSTMTGTGGLKRVSSMFVRNYFVLLPEKTEQQEIAAYLDQKCAEIDKLIEKKEQLVGELENYKKSLIYEYVTGKKEVLS